MLYSFIYPHRRDHARCQDLGLREGPHCADEVSSGGCYTHCSTSPGSAWDIQGADHLGIVIEGSYAFVPLCCCELAVEVVEVSFVTYFVLDVVASSLEGHWALDTYVPVGGLVGSPGGS